MVSIHKYFERWEEFQCAQEEFVLLVTQNLQETQNTPPNHTQTHTRTYTHTHTQNPIQPYERDRGTWPAGKCCVDVLALSPFICELCRNITQSSCSLSELLSVEQLKHLQRNVVLTSGLPGCSALKCTCFLFAFH